MNRKLNYDREEINCMDTCFEEIKKKLGFGVMRMPMEDGRISDKDFTEMVDFFMRSGFNYFDTAHVYQGGESERVLNRCLTSRYLLHLIQLLEGLLGFGLGRLGAFKGRRELGCLRL